MFSIQKKSIVVLLFFLGLILSSQVSFAVGFFVRPTTHDIQAHRGETIELFIDIINHTPGKDQSLEVYSVALDQGTDGVLTIIDPLNTNQEINPRFSNCKDWIILNQKSLKMAPLETVKLPVKIKIPQTASGTYLTGIIIHSQPGTNKGLGIALRFLVRFTISISGTPSRSAIEIINTAIETRSGASTPADFATIHLNNTGNTPVTIEGTCSLLQLSGDRWKRMMTVPVKSTRSYPGTTFWVGTKLPRRIPTGQYKLDYSLTADGRRLPFPHNTLDFLGDPKIGKLVADAEIQVTPNFQIINGGPKARRTVKTIVKNDGDQSLDIFISVNQMPSLFGVSIGDRLGDDISCQDWIQIRTKKIKLRPHSSKPIVYSIVFPDSSLSEATYYAQLVVDARYEDGQQAGTIKTVQAANVNNNTTNPDLRLTSISLKETKNNLVSVVVKTANIGNCHVYPQGEVSIKNLSGTKMFIKKKLNGPDNWVIPFGTPEFFSDIEMDKLSPGSYQVICKLTYDGGQNSLTKSFSIYEKDGNSHIRFSEPGNTQ